eukprot:3295622-Lingulodinium_polyedra.AAC.1
MPRTPWHLPESLREAGERVGHEHGAVAAAASGSNLPCGSGAREGLHNRTLLAAQPLEASFK